MTLSSVLPFSLPGASITRTRTRTQSHKKKEEEEGTTAAVDCVKVYKLSANDAPLEIVVENLQYIHQIHVYPPGDGTHPCSKIPSTPIEHPCVTPTVTQRVFDLRS